MPNLDNLANAKIIDHPALDRTAAVTVSTNFVIIVCFVGLIWFYCFGRKVRAEVRSSSLLWPGVTLH